MTAATLDAFLGRHRAVVRVALARVRGSSPRESGTEMFVAADDLHGTIGGGRLEYMAIARAREMLSDGALADRMDVPLGPEIGQCCGGRVELDLSRMRDADRRTALGAAARAEAALPQVLIFGAGHVGRALADLMQHMPVRAVLVDPRAEELARVTATVETRQSPLPEIEVGAAPPGTAFVVATHDHGLDFLVASEALGRRDAAYVGLIGSATKRTKFDRWAREHCDGLATRDLTCPIGAGGSRDKRPAVIAALVTAEIMTALTKDPSAYATGESRAGPPAAKPRRRLLEEPRA